MVDIDAMVLGHNQFMGVSHLSQENARVKSDQFGNVRNSVEIIKYCSDLGINAMVASSHPIMKDILIQMRTDGLGQIGLYPIIPSAQEYIRQFSEKGMSGLLNDMLAPAGTIGKARIVMKGGLGVLKRDTFDLLGTLIDIEMLPFKGFPVKSVFLHNVLTDLALGLGNQDIFQFWIDYISKNYGAIPAFATMNYARLARTLNEWGMENVMIMASFNKVGFQMNPSKDECEQALNQYRYQVLAMSTLASGALGPQEAYQYLFSLPNIRSVVVGASTKAHAAETFRIIKQNMS